MSTGDHAVVRWQASQTLVLAICVPDLPGALLPLWQLAHPELIPLWLKVADAQVVVVWQLAQSAAVTR